MPRDPYAPGTPEHWLARARGHRAIAGQPKPPEACWEDLAFHAQQAAELAIKAIYQQERAPFEFTHDLERLLSQLKALGVDAPPEVEAAESLTKYATKARYPGLVPAIGEGEYRNALLLADSVIRWAHTLVANDPTP